jgi:hypothetical protein
MNQKEVDKKITDMLESYLANKNNSVSGNNFCNLVISLIDIENDWLTESVLPYLNNIENN